jgi:hypothetical protein
MIKDIKLGVNINLYNCSVETLEQAKISLKNKIGELIIEELKSTCTNMRIDYLFDIEGQEMTSTDEKQN